MSDLIFDELEQRLSMVPRWVILPTIQKQSVAEHCFNVERIATRIAIQWFNITNVIQLAEISQLALHHDDDEALTGDIPATAKKLIKVDKLPNPDYDNMSELAHQIVKLADLMEAWQFLNMEFHLGNNLYYHTVTDAKKKQWTSRWLILTRKSSNWYDYGWRINPTRRVAIMTNLLGVQQAALNAAKGKHGFAYFMEMGLGKTLTTLTEFLELVKAKEATRLVVVCPNSFKNGWRAEIIKHDLPIEPIVYTSGDTITTRAFNEKPPCMIVNYEAIRSDNTRRIIYDFIHDKDAMIVFDESIQIKTYDSAQTKAAIALSKAFKYSRILSGKPITQGPHDLWGQMRAIKQIEGLNYFIFRNSFCRMGGFKGKQVVGAANEERLGELINPHVFRAKKDDWIDLPPKIYSTRQYEMTGAQWSQYISMEREFVTWLNDEENVTVDMALTKYVKLAQIQFGFIIDEEGKTRELVKPASNPRIITLKEIISTEVAGKVVVVYNHRYAGEVLFNALIEYQPAVIRGGMDGPEIANQRDTFNENPKCRVILTQAVAGKYGHTLMGGTEPDNRCSTMILAENTWSLDTRSQLEDRIHRIGQQGNACVYIDLFGSDLDERVISALQRKENVFQAVFRHIKSSH